LPLAVTRSVAAARRIVELAAPPSGALQRLETITGFVARLHETMCQLTTSRKHGSPTYTSREGK